MKFNLIIATTLSKTFNPDTSIYHSGWEYDIDACIIKERENPKP
jgi:hypothetical protein